MKSFDFFSERDMVSFFERAFVPNEEGWTVSFTQKPWTTGLAEYWTKFLSARNPRPGTDLTDTIGRTVTFQ